MLRLLQTQLAVGADTTSDVVVLPVGTWHTDKYGEVDLTRSVCDEIIANFNANVLGRDIRVDVDHEFAEAAGWITGLGYGTFADPVTGETRAAVVMRVRWTPHGNTALSEKKYRYVSAAFGRYTQPATGAVFANVMRAVSLTNDPVLVVPSADEAPSSVEFSDLVKLSEALNLGEVVDALGKNDTPPQLQEASWSTWEALSAFDTLTRQAITEGLTGQALRDRIAELAADLPAAIEKVVSESVAEENAEDAAEAQGAKPPQIDPFTDAQMSALRTVFSSGVFSDNGLAAMKRFGIAQLADSEEPVDPVKELLARFDALMSECDAIVGGTAGVRSMRTLAKETRTKLADLLTKKGGTTTMNETEKATYDAAITELAEIKRTQRADKVSEALDKLSAKGMTEPARKTLEAILLAEADIVKLSDGKEATTADALLAFADVVEFVPVVEAGDTHDQDTDAESDVELSDTEIEVGRQLGLTPEKLRAAKKAAADALKEV